MTRIGLTSIARLAAGGMACSVFLAGCWSVGPDYRQPAAPVPTAYQEGKDTWKPSHPNDAAQRGPWWSIYQDPALAGFEGQVAVANQNLKVAVAAYDQAVAIVDEARAGYMPTVGANASAQRAGLGPHLPVTNQFALGASASWTLDLWGRIRRTVESDVANAQASAGDLASALLSTQATLALDYFQLRSDDEMARILADTVVAFGRSLDITRNQYRQGVAAKSDVAQAQAQLDGVRAQLIALGIQRAQMVHAIAVLMGRLPEGFSVPVVNVLAAPPQAPAMVPSALLERRPDIAAAERRMASANAGIGVAISAYYPDLTLSGSAGFASSAIDSLLHVADRVWSFGGQLAGTVFDGGLRNAQVRQARAIYDGAVANYRQTVLSDFQQVEDQLVALHVLAQQETVQAQAVKEAREAQELILNQYKAGTVAYTAVVTAQAISLSDEQTEVSTRGSLLAASVNLVVALGGGWTTAQLPDGTSPIGPSPATAKAP